MQYKNSELQWGSVSKVIHWITAVAIIAAIFVGLWISILEEGQEGALETWLMLMPIHKSIGLSALVLVIVRFVWLTIFKETPSKLPQQSDFNHKLSQWAHNSLYFLMFSVPLMGWFASMSADAKTEFWGWFLIPNFIQNSSMSVTVFYWVHYYLSWALVILIVGHIFASLWHHFKLKDNTLKRMLPFTKLD